jgi:hypothetical protein
LTDAIRELPLDATGLTVQVVSGEPIVARASEIYREMLSEAGVTETADSQPQPVAPWRRSFHVVMNGTGVAVGVMMATLGNLDQLSIATMVDEDLLLPDPICECPSSAVNPDASGQGVTELLYRSVYTFARRHGARSLATVVDLLTLDLLRDDYGVMFRPLGPAITQFDTELMAVGEEIRTLEDGIRKQRPDFFDYLTEPFTPAERTAFGI